MTKLKQYKIYQTYLFEFRQCKENAFQNVQHQLLPKNKKNIWLLLTIANMFTLIFV